MTSGLDFVSHLSGGRKKSLHITAVIRSMDQAKFDGMAAKERVGANLGFRAPNRIYGRMKRSTLVSTAPPWKLPRAGHFSAIPLGKGFSHWRTKKIQMFNHMADVRFEPAYHHWVQWWGRCCQLDPSKLIGWNPSLSGAEKSPSREPPRWRLESHGCWEIRSGFLSESGRTKNNRRDPLTTLGSNALNNRESQCKTALGGDLGGGLAILQVERWVEVYFL